jgi:chromatin remodeling complex protein RSC6
MEVATTPAAVTTDAKVSTVDSLKSILCALTTESATLKNLILSVKNVLKDVERQSKDYDKLVNKRSRTKGERKPSDTPSGITKPVAISDELAIFLGVAPGTLVPRNEVTKGVSSYVKTHELYDPTNRQKFCFTNKPEGKLLFTLLKEPAEEVTYFNLQRYLKPHYLPTDASKAPVSPVAPKAKEVATPAPAPAVSEPVEPSQEKAKKKILVKKKKTESSAQLAEE